MLKDKTTLRISIPTDEDHLLHFLQDRETAKWFPCVSTSETFHMCAMWSSYFKVGCSLTALDSNKDPIGIATLLIPDFKKLSNTCDFTIVVAPNKRKHGVGSLLIKNLEMLARDKFDIRNLALSVYDTNPAIRLYEKLAYTQCGRVDSYALVDGKYVDRILMQKKLT